MSFSNKINDVLTADAFNNIFPRRSSEVGYFYQRPGARDNPEVCVTVNGKSRTGLAFRLVFSRE